ncbi:MAG: hypothetical protein M1165_01545 [Candidatus Pacearchaeota archaeon]|nr:hypothetical protein [Candidatus Pacearchaeota archaeon]MDE1848979.1 hypothetical protein [Nanoarchaeota archaeon]
MRDYAAYFMNDCMTYLGKDRGKRGDTGLEELDEVVIVPTSDLAKDAAALGKTLDTVISNKYKAGNKSIGLVMISLNNLTGKLEFNIE